jgi:hypothetical protein
MNAKTSAWSGTPIRHDANKYGLAWAEKKITIYEARGMKTFDHRR